MAEKALITEEEMSMLLRTPAGGTRSGCCSGQPATSYPLRFSPSESHLERENPLALPAS
ncbi:MAG: hypothetical protein WKF84_01810 [Pyrinomonadaceae bacterium]